MNKKRTKTNENKLCNSSVQKSIKFGRASDSTTKIPCHSSRDEKKIIAFLPVAYILCPKTIAILVQWNIVVILSSK